MRLADLVPGSSAVVTEIIGTGRVSARLMELGFVPGAVIQVLRRAPFGGPVQYRLHGVSVSMRPAEAANVSVRLCSRSAVSQEAEVTSEPLALAVH